MKPIPVDPHDPIVIPFDAVLSTKGDGFWSVVAGPVRVLSLMVHDTRSAPEGGGGARLYFDPATWPVHYVRAAVSQIRAACDAADAAIRDFEESNTVRSVATASQ